MEQVSQARTGKNLPSQDTTEVSRDRIAGTSKIGLCSRVGLHLKRGDCAISDPARNNPVEIAEIRRDVQGETMGRDALRDMDADRCDLLLRKAASALGPDAGSLGDALGEHPEVFAGENERFFDQPDEVHRTEMRTAFVGQIAAKVDNRVPDKLAWAVVRDVSAAVDLVNLDSSPGEEVACSEDVGATCIAAQCENRRVLHEQQGVTDGAITTRPGNLAHVTQPVCVRDTAELEELKNHGTKDRGQKGWGGRQDGDLEASERDAPQLRSAGR